MQKIIQATKNLLMEAKQLTPALSKLVNEIRSEAHINGLLTPQTEAEFQQLAARFGGFIVRGKLAPLPTVGPDGKPLAPLTVPETDTQAAVNHAPYGFSPEDQAEYNTGYELGLARQQLEQGASLTKQNGYSAGSAAAKGDAGTSPAQP